jgi:hypothetical protein
VSLAVVAPVVRPSSPRLQLVEPAVVEDPRLVTSAARHRNARRTFAPLVIEYDVEALARAYGLTAH